MDTERIAYVLHKLENPGEPSEQDPTPKADAARDVAILSIKSNDNRKLFQQGGAIPMLTQMLSNGSDLEISRATIALATLASSDEFKVEIASAGAIPTLIQLLRHTNGDIVGGAITALANLAVNRDLQRSIVNQGAMEAVVVLLQSPADGMKTASAAALSSFVLRNEQAQLLALEKGAVKILCHLARDGSEATKLSAVAALRNLAAAGSVAEAMVKHEGAVDIIQSFLVKGSDELRLRTISTIRSLLANDSCRASVVDSKGLVPALIGALKSGQSAIVPIAAAALRYALTVDNGEKVFPFKISSVAMHMLLESSLPSSSSSSSSSSSILAGIAALMASIATYEHGAKELASVENFDAKIAVFIAAHSKTPDFEACVSLLGLMLVHVSIHASINGTAALRLAEDLVPSLKYNVMCHQSWVMQDLEAALSISQLQNRKVSWYVYLSLITLSSAASGNETLNDLAVTAWFEKNWDKISEIMDGVGEDDKVGQYYVAMMRTCRGSLKLRGISVISQETIGEGKWMRLVLRDWKDAQGKGGKWEAMERTTKKGKSADGVDIYAILTRKGIKYLVMVMIYRAGADTISIETPAGLVDPGESYEIAALRELKEETGYVGKVVSLSEPYSLAPWMSSESTLFVTIEIDGDAPENQNPQRELEDDERMETLLVPLQHVPEVIHEFSKKKGYSVVAHLATLGMGLSWASKYGI